VFRPFDFFLAKPTSIHQCKNSIVTSVLIPLSPLH
jgi:hypothetical protein